MTATRSPVAPGFSLRHARGALAACALSLLLAVLAWHFTSEAVERRAADRFEHRAVHIENMIRERLQAYEQILRGGAGLFAASQVVSRREWRAYVESLGVEQRYPGLQGIGYAQRIAAGDLAEHIRSVRAEGFPHYAVRPEHARAEYFPIVYLEPFDWRNQRAFGYDMSTEPTRRAAMEHARDTGGAAVSGKVILVQETEEDVQAGFLMYLPVYRQDAPAATAEERRTALKGFVYSPFRMDNLMQGMLGARAGDIELQIYDGERVQPSALMYDSHPELSDAARMRLRFQRTASFTMPGHQWTLRFSSLPGFDAAMEDDQPRIVLGAGVVISLLLFATVLSVETGTARGLMLSHIVDSALDGIVSMDHRGRVLAFNPAAERIFGYRGQDVLGADMAELIIPPQRRDAHRGGLARYLATGKASVLGRRIEVEAMRADGTLFPAEVSITRVGGEDPAVFSGFIRDITRRKQREAELAALNAELEQRVAARTAELEQSNRELEAFAYSVSHDLRAPLRAIHGFSQSLLQDYRDSLDDRGRHYLERIQAGAARMGQLIDDLLKLSRLTRAPLHPESVDLSALARAVMAELQAQEPLRPAHVRVADSVSVRGDPRLLRVALENLLGNAWKFTATRRTAEIEFGAVEEGGRRVCFVRDNGVGFDMAYADKLFGPFQRLHAASEFPGTGIGLATVQRIIHRHGGAIWADAGPDRGATFFFTIGEHADAGPQAHTAG
jgi:PAS domain S-box-containing protein